MILLIWDSYGDQELKLYELEEGSQGATLAELCNEKMANEGGLSKEDYANLEKLSDILDTEYNNRLRLPGPFGPYSEIYTSGYIP